MSEWLIHCTDDLKSGAYYASVDIHDGEQPVMILFKKDGEKTFVVGQGEPVNPHGRLGDLDELAKQIEYERYHHAHTDGLAARHHIAEYTHFLGAIAAARTIIQASK